MKNKQIAHIWAQQSKQHMTGSNFFFEGRAIFSYGRHFPIASFVENKHGNQVILLTSDGYSRSTQRHISAVSYAIPNNIQVFELPLSGKTIDTRWQERYGKEFLAVYDARVKEAIKWVKDVSPKCVGNAYETYLQIIDKANQFNQFCGSRKRYKLDKKIEALYLSKQAEHEAKEAAKNTPEAIAKREALKAAKYNDMVNKWLEGEIHSIPYQHGDKVFMRVRGENIETSQGARFPIDDAKIAWQAVSFCRTMQKTFTPNENQNYKLGHFKIDNIDMGGNVKAGCHYVLFDQIKYCADKLGLSA